MSCENLSAYPDEDEVIIAGGMPCYVLDIEDCDFNGLAAKIIHLAI